MQALAANSPFWHGRDRGLASARAQMFRAYPRADIPPAFASWDEYERRSRQSCAPAMPDYTFLWWDLRPHPRLGTVELRAMDAQSALWSVAGLAALVHGLAARRPSGRRAAVVFARGARGVELPRGARRHARDAVARRRAAAGAARSLAQHWSARRPPRAGDALDEVERLCGRAAAPTASAQRTRAAGWRRCSLLVAEAERAYG